VDGIITINEQGTIELFNRSAERIFGYEAQEVLGRNVRVLMPAPESSLHDSYIANYIATGQQKIIGIGREVQGLRKDGGTFPIRLSVSEVLYEDRRIFTGFVHDLTELHRAQEQLIEAERLAALGEAMAGLAHESRNALQRIQVASEMLQELVLGQEEAVGYIRVIGRAQSDLQRVLQEVREYAAPIHLAYEKVTVDAVVRKAWSDLARERTGRRLALVEHVDCPDLQCELDPFAMGQVFRNVLQNALDATASVGEAQIEVTYTLGHSHVSDSEIIAVALRDNGPGIAAAELGRIFDSFYTTKTRGTGLGLAISKRIVQAHRGEIVVNPDCRCGAELVVRIPRKRA
jgi:PAS domain S-box-containing protein